MKKSLLFITLLTAQTALANDSTGYVATGGVSYIKNDKIAMVSEDLYISKNAIKVAYEFKNLSNKPISETVLFPLPKVPAWTDYEFADVDATLKSFKIWANNKPVQYKTHARAFMYPLDDKGNVDWDKNLIDVTAEFKACGVSEQDIVKVWGKESELGKINQTLGACNNAKLKKLIGDFDHALDPELAIHWEGQVIYEFTQSFAPNTITKIRHSYTPLVGGSVQLVKEQYANFCVDNPTQKTLNRYEHTPYSAVGYILTTGANWAKPINKFKLTVERDKDELVSFCWNGKSRVQKVGDGKFAVTETNFVPKHDLDIAFVQLYNYPNTP